MIEFDWSPPRRPLSSDDVWELARNGCNVEEIAFAGGVDWTQAATMLAEAQRLHAFHVEHRSAA